MPSEPQVEAFRHPTGGISWLVSHHHGVLLSLHFRPLTETLFPCPLPRLLPSTKVRGVPSTLPPLMGVRLCKHSLPVQPTPLHLQLDHLASIARSPTTLLSAAIVSSRIWILATSPNQGRIPLETTLLWLWPTTVRFMCGETQEPIPNSLLYSVVVREYIW